MYLIDCFLLYFVIFLLFVIWWMGGVELGVSGGLFLVVVCRMLVGSCCVGGLDICG